MNRLKNVLAGLAFVFAISAAFAFTTRTGYVYNSSTGGADAVTVEQECQLQNPVICTAFGQWVFDTPLDAINAAGSQSDPNATGLLKKPMQ